MDLRIGSRVEGPGGQRYRVARIEKKFDPDQPRVPAGSPEGGRWTSGATSGIRSYLTLVSGAEGAGPSINKFMLEHGREYKVDAGSFIGGTPHECFKNATLAVLASDQLTYVEGYIDVHGVPIHHAWTVNAAGLVRDYTLRSDKGIRGYFGVPIKQSYMLRSQMKAGIYGVLTWNQAELLLKTKPGDIVAR